MKNEKLSRRRFLQMSAMTTGSVLVAACAGAAAPEAASDASSGSTDSAASSAEQPAAEKVSMVYHTWTVPPESNGESIGINEFMNQNPDYEVELRQTPFADYWTALLTDAGIGDPPDSYLMNNFFWQQYIDEGMAIDLLPSAALLGTPGTISEEYIPSVLEAAMRGGKLYGFPKAVNGSAFVINKTLFDEKGVAVPDGSKDWTWGEFEDTVEAMTDTENNVFGGWIQEGPHWTPTFLLTLGGRFLDPDENRFADGYLNSEENATWVAWMKKMTDAEWMPAPSGLDAFGGSTGAMLGGSIAVTHSDGMHQVAFAVAEEAPYEWTGAKTPVPDVGVELKTHLAIHGTMVPNGVRDVLKSAELAGYAAWGAGTETENPTKMSPRNDFSEKQAFETSTHFRPLYEQAFADTVEVHEGALITHMSILVEEWSDMMERVLLEGQDPQEGLNIAAANYDQRVAEKEA